MADYIIATSSTADLPRTWLEEKNVPFISYTYIRAGQVYEDDCREENRQKLYEEMRKGARFKTSMIGEMQYYDFFRQFLERGQDLVFLDMSRKMSVSYDNSVRAAERLRAEYPERRLYVMDTRCISGGLGLLVAEMAKSREEGFSYDDVIAWGEANKLKIAHRFTVDDLNYLKDGGRVSNAAALVGSLLGIKPVLYVPDGGTLDVVEKIRGRKSALKAVVSSVLRDLQDMDVSGAVIHILHADCLTDAETVRNSITAARPEISEIRISNLGAVIGAHCGPGLLTVFYICCGRNP
ncbi:MAG: DegV family protein [Clostridiales bacterium]|nr:DegV family protein [Clostridiales bacterium]